MQNGIKLNRLTPNSYRIKEDQKEIYVSQEVLPGLCEKKKGYLVLIMDGDYTFLCEATCSNFEYNNSEPNKFPADIDSWNRDSIQYQKTFETDKDFVKLRVYEIKERFMNRDLLINPSLGRNSININIQSSNLTLNAQTMLFNKYNIQF